MIESERTTGGKTTHERRLYISSLPADAEAIAHAVRSHWSIENRLHWCMDVSFNDDQMRARSKAAAHNLGVLKHITLNLTRLDPINRQGGIRARRFIAATSDPYRAHLLGLTLCSCDCPAIPASAVVRAAVLWNIPDSIVQNARSGQAGPPALQRKNFVNFMFSSLVRGTVS